mgnify:CR=1 FL=1
MFAEWIGGFETWLGDSVGVIYSGSVFFFQAGDGIRSAQESRGLGGVYKRQVMHQT